MSDRTTIAHNMCALADHEQCPGAAAAQGCDCPCHGLPGCPSWCAADHTRDDPQSKYVSDDGFTAYAERYHTRDLMDAPNPGAGTYSRVGVHVLQIDDMETGQRQPAGVNVDRAECLDPELARAVAAAICAAADLISTPDPTTPEEG
jgi:hypothetical protein